jgi:hypothetical protein
VRRNLGAILIREASMSVTAHFIPPIHPDTVTMSIAGYLAAAVLCADRRAVAQAASRGRS